MRSKIILVLLLSGFLFGKTLVTVNGHKIDDSIIPKNYHKLNTKQKNKLIEQLIREDLLFQSLLKSDIVNTSEFKRSFAKQKEKVQTSYQALTGKNLTKAQIESIKGSVALMLYKRKKAKGITVTDDEAKRFYEKNKDKFKFLDSIEIADIIVPTENQAKEIISKLKNSKNLKKDFIKMANKYNQNGYMGWFQKGNAPANLFDTVYSAKPKTLITTPIKTKHGYNIIYLLNKKEAGTVSFENAKESIKDFLKKNIITKELKEKIDKLYSKAKIEY